MAGATANTVWRVCEIPTPLGPYCVVVDSTDAICMAYWKTQHVRAVRHWLRWYGDQAWVKRALVPAVAARVAAYFAGHIAALDCLVVAPRGTDFERRVWSELRHIPAGQRVSYSCIAQALGQPKAARAVGHAIGNNPIVLAIPCHRVVQKDGRLGGYAGGVKRKRWLLAHECLAEV